MAADFANFWAPFLERASFVVLDGGLATELERRGADLRDPLWSARLLLEHPELIRDVHEGYLRAGADVIITSSYQASFAGLARRGLDQAQATTVLRNSVRLAVEARDAFWQEAQHSDRLRPLVAASIGCYGAFLHDGAEYRGDYGLTPWELADWHRPRFEVLANSGADLLACETIPCRAEAEALVGLLHDHPEVPAWLSFSCRDDKHVCHGETLAECAEVASGAANVVAVGVNCTAPRFVEPLLRSLVGCDRPQLAYPNSGATWDAQAGVWKCPSSEPQDWTAWARAWRAAGARLIGGCCRTTPATVAAIARARQ